MTIGIHILLSPLHDQARLDSSLKALITGMEEILKEPLVLCGLPDFQSCELKVLVIQSGGVEQQFESIYRTLQEPYLLLADGYHNSLPAAMEICAFLQQRGLQGEILHGGADEIASRLMRLRQLFRARARLSRMRLGIIGEPSHWLIASRTDRHLVSARFGIELVDIPIEEFYTESEKEKTAEPGALSSIRLDDFDDREIERALFHYTALRSIIDRYRLDGFTLRCFDMIERFRSTGCLALSILNSEGIVSGCEGDVPSLISMAILNCLSDKPVFMANPSSISIKDNTVILAHCAAPLSMLCRCDGDTHFESGLGMAVHGDMEPGRVTLFRMAADMSHYFVSDGDLLYSLNDPSRCRTQVKVRLDRGTGLLLMKPLGNHHLLCRGEYAKPVRELLRYYGAEERDPGPC